MLCYFLFLLPLIGWAQAEYTRRNSIGYQLYPRYVTFLPKDKLDSVWVYANTDIVPVIFIVDRWDTKPGEEADSICATINRILKDHRVNLAYVWVGGSASPEGPPERNRLLGEQRAKVLTDYLFEHTDLPPSLLRVSNLWEEWSWTVRELEKRPHFPYQKEILEIIRTEPDREKCKRKIQAIDRGRTWHKLIVDVFPTFRNARIVIVCDADLPPMEVNIARTEVKQEAMPYNPQPAPPPPIVRYRFLALKTNLLSLAAGAVANLDFEAELWPRWSIDIPVWYSPYDLTSTVRFRFLATQPELRYWTRKAGEGHFFGLHTHVVGFDVSVNHKGRYQDPDHALWGMGLSWGYVTHLDARKRWRLELNIGAGFAEYSFDVYHNESTRYGQVYRSGSDWYWGITRAGLSIGYTWYKKRKT